ncbi:hypothetical protein OLX23_20950 [Novosphingobium sp. JCM 18896]|nr:hypothetical protein [Novosphingobium sp. JCM 18896]
MRSHHIPTITAVAASIFSTEPANACIDIAPFKFEDIRYADAIVVGRISNFHVVLDQRARDDRAEMLKRPDLSPEFRAMMENQSGWITDYAEFDVNVHQTITGNVPRKLVVTWDNSTFSEPEVFPAGPYLIALRRPQSMIPPLRGGSATVLPTQRPDLFTVLQAPCAGVFILDSSQENIADAQRALKGEAVASRHFGEQVSQDLNREYQQLDAVRRRAFMWKVITICLSIAGFASILFTLLRRRRKINGMRQSDNAVERRSVG